MSLRTIGLVLASAVAVAVGFGLGAVVAVRQSPDVADMCWNRDSDHFINAHFQRRMFCDYFLGLGSAPFDPADTAEFDRLRDALQDVPTLEYRVDPKE